MTDQTSNSDSDSSAKEQCDSNVPAANEVFQDSLFVHMLTNCYMHMEPSLARRSRNQLALTCRHLAQIYRSRKRVHDFRHRYTAQQGASVKIALQYENLLSQVKNIRLSLHDEFASQDRVFNAMQGLDALFISDGQLSPGASFSFYSSMFKKVSSIKHMTLYRSHQCALNEPAVQRAKVLRLYDLNVNMSESTVEAHEEPINVENSTTFEAEALFCSNEQFVDPSCQSVAIKLPNLRHLSLVRSHMLCVCVKRTEYAASMTSAVMEQLPSLERLVLENPPSCDPRCAI